MSGKNLGIYIHIPFCNRKCPYCSFYSITPNELAIKNYVNKVCENIKAWGNSLCHTVDTIYIGGGTPSSINSHFIADIILTIKESFRHDLKEITIEVNPCNHNLIDFELLNNIGVNRVSIGAQSLNPSELKLLGRKHNVSDIILTIKKCRKNNINNLSLDLMIGIPNQDSKSLTNSLEFCVEQKIPHVSCYILKVEENTPYFYMKDTIPFLNDDEQSDLYELMCEKLKKSGYNHYEISNFCLENYQSKHNLKYWQCKEYLGIGPSAHSFIDGERFYYKNSINDFLSGCEIVKDGNGGSIEEYCMLALRLSSGLDNSEFLKKFNCNIPHKYFKKAKEMEKYGVVKCEDNKIKLTDKGFLLSNSIILNIIY